MAESEKVPAFTLRLSADALAKLKQLAKSQRRSMTAVVEVLVLEAAAKAK